MTPNEYEVIGRPLTDIEIAVGGEREIAQNIRTIITTWRGSLFLDRQFGINTAIIDQPENIAVANLSIDLTNQIAQYEPRAEITGIDFERSNLNAGELIPVVHFRIKEGVLL